LGKEEKDNDNIASNLNKLEKRFEMMNDRLDNIDSIVTAVTERVMKQPVTMIVTCSHCGHKVEVALLGVEKPTK
jgi:transcription elongation factor Elf1